MKQGKRYTGLALIIVVILLAATALAGAEDMVQEPERRIVAIVNGQEITYEHYIQTLELMAGQTVLEQMIWELLIEQKMEAHNVTVTADEINEFLEFLMMQMGGPEGLLQYMFQQQMTYDDLFEEIQMHLVLNKLVRAEVQVTDEEVVSWFEENKEMYKEPELVEVRHILVETADTALELLALLEDGADFLELANEHSIDDEGPAYEHSLGRFARGMASQNIEDVAFSLDVGEYGLAEADYGWHILQLVDKSAERQLSLEDVFEDVRYQVAGERARSIEEFVNDMTAGADIQILHTGI